MNSRKSKLRNRRLELVKERVVSVRFNKGQHSKLEGIAANRGMFLSEFIRHLGTLEIERAQARRISSRDGDGAQEATG